MDKIRQLHIQGISKRKTIPLTLHLSAERFFSKHSKKSQRSKKRPTANPAPLSATKKNITRKSVK